MAYVSDRPYTDEELKQILSGANENTLVENKNGDIYLSSKGSALSGSGEKQPTTQGSYQYGGAVPTYESRYSGQIERLLNDLGGSSFSYDPERDETYQQYKKSYTKAGQRAMQDTLGQISARTGGLASSYAGAASQQAYDNYMSALADKIPELKQLAYEMYQDEIDRKYQRLNSLMSLEDMEYGRYADQLNQYNTDRSFDYGVYTGDRDYNYQLSRDAIEDLRYADELAYERARANRYQGGGTVYDGEEEDYEPVRLSASDIKKNVVNYRKDKDNNGMKEYLAGLVDNGTLTIEQASRYYEAYKPKDVNKTNQLRK